MTLEHSRSVWQMPDVAKKLGQDSRPARASDVLTIDSHRMLLAKRTTIAARLAADPGMGKLLFANPALAFRDAGVKLSPAIGNHVLHTVKQSAEATTRREKLVAQLREALGVVPHPSDPTWLARTLFTRLKVAALETAGHQPVYTPAVPPEAERRMRARLPPASRPRLPARTGSAAQPRPVPLRLDLDAEVPELPEVPRRPQRLTLPELWFYLPTHDLVRPLLELGILEVSVLPTLTREQYDAVRGGARTGGFLDWVDTVTFREVPPAAAKGTAKKTAAKKTPVKKAPVKKAPVKKAPVKKAGVRQASGTTKETAAKRTAARRSATGTRRRG